MYLLKALKEITEKNFHSDEEAVINNLKLLEFLHASTV